MQTLDKHLLTEIEAKLAILCHDMVELETSLLRAPLLVDESHRRSAQNLAHYLALRQHDLRHLQDQLTLLGLSSLGRAESHVFSSVLAVMRAVEALLGNRKEKSLSVPAHPGDADFKPIEIGEGAALLEGNTDILLGPAPDGRRVRIMVTMSTEAATSYSLVRDLVHNGMDCMRINCAHDGPEQWLAMIHHLQQAREETGRPCRILMDIAGPKLRTGPIEPGPQVIKCRPSRDLFGHVITPARIWLTPGDHPHPAPASGESMSATVSLSARFLKQLRPEDAIHLHDARGSERTLHITQLLPEGCWAETSHTIYLKPGLHLDIVRPGKAHGHQKHHDSHASTQGTTLGPLPALSQTIRLKPGDTLLLRRGDILGKPARFAASGQIIAPAEIGISLPEVLDHAQAGQPIWLDDGKIGGILRSITTDGAAVEITQARPEGENLGAEKGINLPETRIDLAALTEEDIVALQFIVKHADLVGYSFVRTPADVQALLDRLKQLGGLHLGLILKIETRQGFDNLPALLLAAMQTRSIGIMIARGDLAVECGYQRLAEVQEEILWICEAAHVPVVWATQVLESLARKGIPSRSEITDAAMGERAECVMLNKGPYIVTAVSVLADILTRMQDHHQKKQSMLRQLHLAGTPHVPKPAPRR